MPAAELQMAEGEMTQESMLEESAELETFEPTQDAEDLTGIITPRMKANAPAL